jgi:hypothetical protein
MRINFLFTILLTYSIILSSCDGLPRTDEVDIAPYNTISGLSLPFQSQKKDNMLYVLGRKDYLYCIDLNNYSSLFNEDLKDKGISGTLSNNRAKNTKNLADAEKILLKLPKDTIRPAKIKLSDLKYSLTPISFSLTPDGTSLYIVVCVACSDNADIDGMYYVLNFDTTTKAISNAFPLDKLTSYRVSDDELTDVTTDAKKSTGNIASQIYANDTNLFISGTKRLFIIPTKDGKVDPDYDYYTDKENSFISAETTNTMSPYLIQEHNDKVYLSSREKDYGVHVYSYNLEEKTISWVKKESLVNDVIGNHYPACMNVFENKLYCSSYEKLGNFNIETENTEILKNIEVCDSSFVCDVKTIEDYYAVGFNYKIEEDMTVSSGYNHFFIRSAVAFWDKEGNRLTADNDYWIDGNIKAIELWKNGNSYFSISICQDKNALIINQLK